MAAFYGGIRGNRGIATRCGTKSSGINAVVTGATIGAAVKVHTDAATGEEFVVVEVARGYFGNSDGKTLFRRTFHADGREV